jgi:taurine dioxygenase
VNRIFTRRIIGLEAQESEDLLQSLFEHAARPEFQCRFQWQVGSVAFWDNRSAQHQALWDYFPHRRRGWRVTIQGEVPVFQG